MATRKRMAYDDDLSADNLFYRQTSSKLFSKSNIEFGDIDNEAVEEPENPEPQPPQYCLPYLQAVMLASVLEDCLSQLRILDECNNELRILKTTADFDELRAKKYQVKRQKTVDDLTNSNRPNLDCMQFKLDKLAADRIYCTQILSATYLELALYRCYSVLTGSNQDAADRDLYEASLVEEEARNRISRRDLMKQLRQQRNHIKSVAYDIDLIIEQLKSRVEDAALNAEVRSRYILNWERGRTEQHQQTIHDKEAGPSESINYYNNRSDQEQRVHAEVELLVNIFINEILNKVEHWMNKYDTDMELIDLQIQITKNKYQDEVEKRVNMEQTYVLHEKQMKNWIQFKEDRKKAIMYKEKMTKSAIIVQAWWRGILVRLELGPYKPKRKPPPPPPGKKKK